MDIIGYTESGSIEVSIDGRTAFIPDDPGNRHRQMIAEWEFDAEGNRVNTIPAYEPPPVDTSYRVYKLIFCQRQTPEEAATLEAALNAEDAKMRLMYNAAEYFLSDDSLFAYLHWVVAVALGSEAEPNFARADELLAPMEAS